jgi:organic radical activating enzyme
MEKINYKSPTYYELAAPPELDWRKHRGDDWWEYRREWDARAETRTAGLFPLHLDIDPTNRCNLKCAMCPRTYYISRGQTEWNPGGAMGVMDFALYEKLIEEGRARGLKSVKLNFLGEPLLYPKIIDMVRLAREAGLWVMLNTNATLLDKNMAEKLLLAGLTDIFFSFDSPYKDEYEKIRVGAGFEEVLANIRAFMRLKDEMGQAALQTRASMVLPEGGGGAEGQDIQRDYIKLFRDMGVAEIGFGLPSVMGRDYGAEGVFAGFVCPDIFRRMFVFWDGPAGPCCGDWERRLIMGDTLKTSVAEIWQGAEYQKLRAAHSCGHYESIAACRACSVPYLNSI